MTDLTGMGRDARRAARVLAVSDDDARCRALQAMAECLVTSGPEILAANAADVAAARTAGLADSLIDRLLLDADRLDAMAAGVRTVAAAADPVGERFDERVLDNGLRICRQRIPLGVLGVIYESRPNVTIDVAALAIRTGNVTILRGGKETLNSNRALVNVARAALESAGLPADAVQAIDSKDRALVEELLRLDRYVDVIVPRGGNALHRFCREKATIPVITGGIGICHLYVDATVDAPAAIEVIHNAKVQRPSVCNALDTILVHESVAADLLPRIRERLAASGVTFRADDRAAALLDPGDDVASAGEGDFDTEWLSLVLGLKVVDDLGAALDHIAAHGTGHSDGILTGDATNARRFLAEVDSAAVYHNASTRFTDGAQLGLGAEVAVSTQRLHARGPMGLPELTTYKWVVQGNYTVRE